MNHKRYILLSLLVYCMVQLSIVSVKANPTKKIKPYEDSTVSAYSPNNNYGSGDYLEIGADIFGYQRETFLKFPLPIVETEITKVYISSYWYSFLCETPLSVSACLVSNTWNEYTITWNNKPSHSTLLDTDSTLTDGEYFTIDISLTHITQGSTLSICIYENAPYKPDGLQSGSREGGYNTPELVVEYKTPPMLIIVPIMVGIVIAGIIGTIIYINIQKKKKQRIQETIQTKVQHPSSFAVSAPKFCTNCGAKLEGKSCSNCGRNN